MPQVLKGDIRPAIETHEMLYQVTKKHNFLPEVMRFSLCSASKFAVLVSDLVSFSSDIPVT